MIFFQKVEAVALYFEAEKDEFYQKEVFSLDLKINTQGEKINVVQAEISFPKEKLEFLGFIAENSLISLWAEEPTSSKEEGKISFIGGIPGGFEGEGKILTLFFLPIFSENSTTTIEFSFTKNSHTLLNDGWGTEAQLNLLEKKIILLPTSTIFLEDKWQKKLKTDKEPPQILNIFLEKEETFNGKYLLAIFAFDKETGIDYYEIESGDFRERRKSPFFLLEENHFSPFFKLKVTDRAGNERKVEYCLENMLI